MGKRRFSGGDNLTGFEMYLHEVLVLNELGGDLYKGYELSKAETNHKHAKKSSGYSFSANQYDLAHNEDGRALFKQILELNSFSKAEVKKFLDMFKSPANIFPDFKTNQDVIRIKNALSSDVGAKLIDVKYQEHIKSLINTVDKVTKESQKYLQQYMTDPKVRLIMADFFNQHGTDKNEAFKDYLKGQRVTFFPKAKHHQYVTLNIPSVKSPDDLIKELRKGIDAIANGPHSRDDIARRQGNIDEVAKFIRDEEKHYFSPLDKLMREVELFRPKPEHSSTKAQVKDHHGHHSVPSKKEYAPKHGIHSAHDSPRVHALKKAVEKKHEQKNKKPHPNDKSLPHHKNNRSHASNEGYDDSPKLASSEKPDAIKEDTDCQQSYRPSF